MKTLEQAAESEGITIDMNSSGKWLNLHFSPMPNWYGCILGFDCPVCEKPIDWEWQGELPSITTPSSTRHLKPLVKGAELKAWGHRWISLKCSECKTDLFAENYD